MRSRFKKAVLLLSGIIAGGQLFAQTPDTTKSAQTLSNYVKPFSQESAFRTWSIGINAGVLTTYTIIQDKKSLDFSSPDGELGYSAYIKKQVLSSLGIQANFMLGKLRGDHAQYSNFGSQPYPYQTFK